MASVSWGQITSRAPFIERTFSSVGGEFGETVSFGCRGVVHKTTDPSRKDRPGLMVCDLGLSQAEARESALHETMDTEVARLQGHLGQFTQIIDETDKPSGRTLDFIAQEMLREANTMGSKCQDASMARCIVEIKGAVDRIKEQVQNIE